jgi:chloramphenicol 3-O phosphotransferase
MIILINGASSSGKTSVARALQSQWDGPLLYWSLDKVISQLPVSYTGNGGNSSEGFEILGSEIFARKHGRALNNLSAAYVASLATAGYDVVVDYIFLNEEILSPFTTELRDHALCFVGITCNQDIINARNIARNDRITGLSVSQQSSVHFCEAFYDLKIDSSETDPEALAAQINSHIQQSTFSRGIT